VVSQAIGLIVSGSIISKFLPSATKLLRFSVIVSASTIFSTILFSQFGCNSIDTIDLGAKQDFPPWSYNLQKNCSSDCNCPSENQHFVPVCDEEIQKLYFSPCHAGCEKTESEDIYSDCSCAGSPDTILTAGFCSGSGCFGQYLTFILISATLQALSGATTIGRMLITYR